MKLLSDKISHGPGMYMHQGIFENDSDYFPTILELESPSFRQRFCPNVLHLFEQASGVRLNLASRPQFSRVRLSGQIVCV